MTISRARKIRESRIPVRWNTSANIGFLRSLSFRTVSPSIESRSRPSDADETRQWFAARAQNSRPCVRQIDRERESSEGLAHACTQVRGAKVNVPWTPSSTFSRTFFLLPSTLHSRRCIGGVLACRVGAHFTDHPLIGPTTRNACCHLPNLSNNLSLKETWDRRAKENYPLKAWFSFETVLRDRFIFRGIDAFFWWEHGILAWLEDFRRTDTRNDKFHARGSLRRQCDSIKIARY